MAHHEPPSPLKVFPDPKRPKSAQNLRSISKAEESSMSTTVNLTTRQFNLVPLDSFDTTKFPTNSEVLRRIFYISDFSKKRSISSIADQVFTEMEDIYRRALAIERPTKQAKNCKAQMCKLHDEFKLARANYNHNPSNIQSKVQAFIDKLPQICDLTPRDAEEQISKDRLRSQMKKNQDIAFLHDQRKLRRQALAKEDIAYSKKSEAKINREISLVKQQISSSLSVSSPKQKPMSSAARFLEPTLPRLRGNIVSTNQPLAADIDLRPGDDTKVDPDYVQSRFLRDRPKKKNIVSKNSLLLQTSDRRQLSSRALTSVAGAALVEMGEDLNDHVFSHSTINRNRRHMRAETAGAIKTSFCPPKRATVHFDGKLLTDLSGGFGDRLAVMLSGDTPDCTSGKLLSARLIKDSSGKEQADEVVRALKEWKAQNNIVAMCFDTTSSNTGWINGAATRIEKSLAKIQKRPVLWLPCRHHIPELFIKAAWEILFGKDMAPHYNDFKVFQQSFPNLDKKNYHILEPKQWMNPHINRVVEFCHFILNSEKQPRDDYLECLHLTLLILGSPPKPFSFKACGAFHKARWMAPLIYGEKMFLFRSTLKESKAYLSKLERFVVFASLFYVEYWFSAHLASEAPYMDLKFYKSMLQYQKSDKAIAKAILDKFYGHTWYLNQHYVPFSLFSRNVSKEEKAKIATKLTKIKSSKEYSCGYPMPVPLSQLTLEQGLALKLSEFVDTESLFMFDAFGFKKDWLDKPVDTWKNFESFKEMENWVRTLKVTNDTAERGVKLVSDFCTTLTKDSEDLQNLLQVVEQHRREYPDVNKATLMKASK